MRAAWRLCLPGLFLLIFLSGATVTSASEPTDDCVIRDFVSELTLEPSNSLKIKERLTVDCGDLPDKHGIFRILPTKMTVERSDDYPYTPIKLAGITDEREQEYKYKTINNWTDNTLTWKIGDPKQTITGTHVYQLDYMVDNVVHPTADGSKQLYWNLSGNFWQLPIDQFSATIHFPVGINQENLEPKLFLGEVGSTATTGTSNEFSDPQTLIIRTNKTLADYQGVTLQTKLPSGVIAAYRPSFLQRFGNYLWLLLPLIALIFGWLVWKKHGDDPNLRLPGLVQYTPPNNLSPLELGFLESYGNPKDQYITATVIDLAVRGFISIKEVNKKSLLGKKDWQLTLLRFDRTELKSYEATILNLLFLDLNLKEILQTAKQLPFTGDVEKFSQLAGEAIVAADDHIGRAVMLSERRNIFYRSLADIKKQGDAYLDKQGVFVQRSFHWKFIFALPLLFLIIWAAIPVLPELTGWFVDNNFSPAANLWAIASILGSVLILLFFAQLMPKRTLYGAQLLHQLRGFRLYLAKAEKYRMPFYEQEGIFEKYLPYAIAFGLTGNWIRAMREIYGPKRAASYLPAWYVGSSGQALAATDFEANISSLSNAISESVSSSPSSSGGGFSGGGGGGGGGGSW